MKKNQLLPEIPVPMHESPEAFKARFKKDEDLEDADIHSAIRGIEKVDSKLKKINKVRERILADRTLNKAAKQAEFLKYVRKVDNELSEDIARVSRIVDRRTQELSEVINREVTEEAGGRFSSEIRSHVFNLPHKTDRMQFIKKRIDAGDFESASAVLGSKHYLAGLDEETQKNLLNYYREKRFSKQMKIRKAMDKIGDSMLHKVTMTTKFRKSIENKDTISDVEAMQARIEAMAD